MAWVCFAACGVVAPVGCRGESPPPPAARAEPLAERVAPASTEPVAPASAAPEEPAALPAAAWPQERVLPEALAQPPESFGEVVLAPGAESTVCNMRLWTAPAADGGGLALHGGVLPDFVDAPQPGVNVRTDTLPSGLEPAGFYRLDRLRYLVLHEGEGEGEAPGSVEVYLDRTFWEAPLSTMVDALVPGATSTFWLSSAGRERMVFADAANGERVELALALEPLPDGAGRWRVQLRALHQGADGARDELLLEPGTPLHDLSPEHALHVLDVRAADAARFDVAAGVLETREPIPTLHVQLMLARHGAQAP